MLPQQMTVTQKKAVLKDRSFLTLFLFFLSGLILGLNLPCFFRPLLAVCVLLLLVLYFPAIKKQALFSFFCFFSLLLGLLRAQYSLIIPPDDLRCFLGQEREQVVLKGLVVRDPDFDQEEQRVALVVQAEEVSFQGKPAQAVFGRVRVIVHDVSNPPILFYGDEVNIKGSLFAPFPPTNPGEFDYRDFLASQGIYGLLSVNKSGEFIKLKPGSEFSLLRFSQKLRKKLGNSLDKALPPEQAALLKGVLFSDRSDLAPRVKRDFSISGLAFVLAVAGLHVNLVAACFFALFRLLSLRRKTAVLFCFIVVLLYALVTGLQQPTLRAASMFFLWGLALMLDRDTDFYVSLAFSAVLILFFDPQAIYLLSFQLSFLATLAIFAVGLPLASHIKQLRRGDGKAEVVEGEISLEPSWADKLRENRRLRVFKEWLTVSLAISFAIQAVLFPLVAYDFHYIPLAALAANPIVVPWMGLLIGGGLLVCVLGAVSPLLAGLAGGVVGVLTKGFQTFVCFCAALPWSHVPAARFPLILVFAFYLILVLFLTVPWFSGWKKWATLLGLWFLIFICWQIGFQILRPGVQVFFLDVGQGDCSVLFLHHRVLVIDGGPGGSLSAGDRVLVPFLHAQGVRQVDAVVLTHPHADHAGGLPALLENFQVGMVLGSGDCYNGNRAFRLLLEDIREKRIPYYAVQAGEEWGSRLGLQGVCLRVLNPPAKQARFIFTKDGRADLDNNSVVMKISVDGQSMLFAGDVKEKAQKVILFSYKKEELTALLFKVPHHGSAGAANAIFFSAVAPRVAVILAGRNNRFHFPRDKPLKVLRQLRAQVWRTDQDGAIYFEGQNQGFKVTKVR